MSLNFELGKIKDHEAVCWRRITDEKEAEEIRKFGTGGFMGPPWREDEQGVFVMNSVTNSLIWMMMGLGCSGKITAKNVELVIEQVAVEQRLYGARLRKRDEDGETWHPWYITAEDVRAHIGLWTNCFSHTKASFKKRVWEELSRNSVQWVEDQVSQQQVEIKNTEAA